MGTRCRSQWCARTQSAGWDCEPANQQTPPVRHRQLTSGCNISQRKPGSVSTAGTHSKWSHATSSTYRSLAGCQFQHARRNGGGGDQRQRYCSVPTINRPSSHTHIHTFACLSCSRCLLSLLLASLAFLSSCSLHITFDAPAPTTDSRLPASNILHLMVQMLQLRYVPRVDPSDRFSAAPSSEWAAPACAAAGAERPHHPPPPPSAARGAAAAGLPPAHHRAAPVQCRHDT